MPYAWLGFVASGYDSQQPQLPEKSPRRCQLRLTDGPEVAVYENPKGNPILPPYAATRQPLTSLLWRRAGMLLDVQPDANQSLRLTTTEAAERLGISVEAVRGRIKRGTLRGERDPDGTVYVLLDANQLRPDDGQLADRLADQSELVADLRERIVDLKEQLGRANEQLEQANERDRENRRLLAAALERIPPQLETPSEPSESPETATEGEEVGPSPERTPWWRRVFGG